MRFDTRVDFVDAQRRALAAMTNADAKTALRHVPKQSLIRLYRFDDQQGATVRDGSFRTLERAAKRAEELSLRFAVEVRDDALPTRQRVRQQWRGGRMTFDARVLA